MGDEMDIDDEFETEYRPSFVLIAIDTHPSMFVKNENSASAFEMSIKACHQIADSLIFTQSTRNYNQFAVVVAKEDDKASLLDFNKNILESVKILKNETDLSHADLLKKYQRKGDFDLGSFFLFCKKKYKEIKSQFYKRTIIYITNDDDPVVGDRSKRFTALNEVKNLDAMDIILEMITMNSDFNYSLFYNELFSQMQTPAVEQLIQDEDGLLEKLSSSVVLRYSQRKIGFFPFKGDDKRFLKVVQKKTISVFKLYKNAFVDIDGNIVKKIVVKDDTIARKFRLRFGTSDVETIEFFAHEYNDLRNNEFPIGYTLMCVSERITDVGITLSSALILEVESTEEPQLINYFNNFWKYCVEHEKVLICVRKLKQLDKIRFAELIPKYANNKPVFVVKTIPFANEIHQLATASQIKEEFDDEKQITEEQSKIMTQVINELTYDYDPKMFPNPSIAKKKAFLKSKLLDQKLEEVEDVTLSTEGIDEKLAELSSILNKEFVREVVGQKRKKSEPAKKRYVRKTK